MIRLIRLCRDAQLRALQTTAAERDESTFMTETLCARGHSGKRYTVTGQCVICKSEISAAARLRNREAMNDRTRQLYVENQKHIRQRDNTKRRADDSYNARQRAYRNTNSESINANRRSAYASDPAPHRERSKAYAETHPSQRRESARRWIRANKDKVRERHAREYYADIQKSRARSRNRYHVRRSITKYGISWSMLQAWTNAMPKLCFYCGANCVKQFHVDHFVPLARGGQHVLTNLRIACPHCNLVKAANTTDGVERRLCA